MIGKKTVKIVSLFTIIVLLTNVLLCCPVSAIQSGNEDGESLQSISASNTKSDLFSDYLALYADAEKPDSEIAVIDMTVNLSEENNSSFSKEINVEKTGLYAFEFTYKTPGQQTIYPAVAIKLNGNVPFEEATQISLPTMFKDEISVKKGDLEIPETVAIDDYQTRFLYDTMGYYGGLLEFYLEQGKNIIEISAVTGNIEIKYASFKKYRSPKSYSELKDNLTGNKYEGKEIIVEAEVSKAKSDSTIYAVNDRSSSSVSPSSPYERWLNAIGGINWQNLGQWIEWEIDVPKDGQYKFCFKYRKDTKVGLNSNRRIYIDNEIPYKELESYAFDYTSTFENEVLTTDDGEEMLFYLSKGKHTVKMEVSFGEYSAILPHIYDAARSLQDCYRQFIVVMGTAPDSLRDYQLEKFVPETLEKMKQQRVILENMLKELEKISGSSSSGTSLMISLIEQIKRFEEDSYYIAGNIQSFKTNIASVITWILDAKVQPLRIDYISVFAPDKNPSASKSSKWKSIIFKLKSFIYTFASDYEYAVLDTNEPDTLTVWDPSGATEFSIWRQLIEKDFTAKHPEIKINFKNVSTGFQEAFLAGMLPDVYIGISAQSLMEFAFRDVIVTPISDVAQKAGDDLSDVLEDYNNALYYPVQWKDKTYGYPMDIGVPAVFYRTDTLSEMGLEPPDTWDDVIHLISMLQKKNLQCGIAPEISAWTNMIYQSGGKRFNENRDKAYFLNEENTNIVIETFSKFTSIFTEYSSPVSFSAFDRFRTGEMPIIFGDLSTINSLEVLAPEINGKWDFTHYPGTKRTNKDGTEYIDYTISGGSATYMIITNRRPEMSEKAWEFIKWRGSVDTLVSINRRLEMAIGRSVRGVSANREAQKQIPWSKKAQKLYDFYEDWRISEPEVPGGYFINRAFTNAWTAVYYQSVVPADALKLYIPTANAEIKRRREYFGIDTKD